MINKKNLWFITLFSLILVLSIYYITMPSELLMTTNNIKETSNPIEPTVSIEESNILTALRVEKEEQVSAEIEELQTILVSSEATTEEKNNAYEQIKNINNIRAEEEKLEKQISETYNLKSFVKITGDQIRIVISSKEHDNTMANNIMRTIQSNYEQNKYISVKFES